MQRRKAAQHDGGDEWREPFWYCGLTRRDDIDSWGARLPAERGGEGGGSGEMREGGRRERDEGRKGGDRAHTHTHTQTHRHGKRVHGTEVCREENRLKVTGGTSARPLDTEG